MSEVLRFWCHEALNIRCVREEDYDTALSQLDALREELYQAKEARDREMLAGVRLQRDLADCEQRLADAERRNSDQLAMLHMAKELLSTISLHRTMAPNYWCDSFKSEVADRLEKLRAALNKPEEAKSCGLSEKALSLIDEEIRNKGLPS